MNCPRCKTPVGPLSDPDSIVTCPGCGSRLMTRAAALRSQGGPKKAAANGASLPPPSATLPPTAVARLRSAGAARDGRDVPGADPPTSPALPAVTTGIRRPAPAEPRPAAAAPDAALEQILEELRAVREAQGRILDAVLALRRGPDDVAPAAGLALDGGEAPGRQLSPIRAGKRRSVLLIDDDPKTREEAARELAAADVPVRVIGDGNAALAAIAGEKPDAIALEVALGGEMSGKDLVNMVKATMEWVDIPIILWTRQPIANQREAQQVHGADEVVPKASGAAALVARVITVFRRP